MTPVQQKVLTELPSSSTECLVQAKTGTGKTIAFLLPALQALLDSKPPPQGQVAILILSPTRELALQIAKECDQITVSLPRPLECHTAFGGTARASNLKKFMTGKPSILVATPGRLNDYLSEEMVRQKFENLRTLILDEADTMLEQGFLLDIKKILKQLPPKSTGWQGMCFSATIPDKVKAVVSCVLNRGYLHLSTIDKSEPPTVAKVPQFSVIVPGVKNVFNALYSLIKLEQAQSPNDFKTIVFGTTANGVALLAALFTNLMPELKVYQLQSRLSQNVRTRTTDAFKAAASGLMFASDVIGRGMDFPNVGLVIQLGLPASGEQYVHRVGRTARAGNEGRAVIVLTENESYFVRVNRQLPITPYPTDVMSNLASAAPAVSKAFNDVDELAKSKAYSAFLGFNKTFMKNLCLDTSSLVRTANDYAYAMGCPEPPMIDTKIIGKMGLKGVQGLRVGRVERDTPPRGGGRFEKPAGNANANANTSGNGRSNGGGRGRGNGNGSSGRNGSSFQDDWGHGGVSLGNPNPANNVMPSRFGNGGGRGSGRNGRNPFEDSTPSRFSNGDSRGGGNGGARNQGKRRGGGGGFDDDRATKRSAN